MASYTLTTTARQDDALARVLRSRNVERSTQGLPPYPDAQAFLQDEFNIRLSRDEDKVIAIEKPLIGDLYGTAAPTVRQQVRTLLGAP